MQDAERRIVSPLTCLQQRCIDVFSRDWADIGVERQGDAVTLLRQQNALVLGELMAATLESAAKDSKGRLVFPRRANAPSTGSDSSTSSTTG